VSIQAPLRILHGTVKSAFQGLQAYAVQLDGTRGETLAYAVGSTRGGLGSRESGSYAVGARVLVAYISSASANTAVIVGAGGDAKNIGVSRLPTFAQYPQSAGVEFHRLQVGDKTVVTPRRLNAQLFSKYKRLKNYGNGNADTVDGDWTQVNTFGGGIGVEAFRAWLHGSAMSSVECLFDDTTRIVGKTLEVMSGGAWSYDRILGQLAERVGGRSYYYADVITAQPDQLLEFDGAAYNGEHTIYTTRASDNLLPTKDGVAPAVPPTLFHEYRGVDGAYILTSAASVTLQKYVGLPNVRRRSVTTGDAVPAHGLPGACLSPELTAQSTFSNIEGRLPERVGATAACRTSAINRVGSYIIQLVYKNLTSATGTVIGINAAKAHPMAALLDQAGLCLSVSQQGLAAIADNVDYNVNLDTVGNTVKATGSTLRSAAITVNIGITHDAAVANSRRAALEVELAKLRPLQSINYEALLEVSAANDWFKVYVYTRSFGEQAAEFETRLAAWTKGQAPTLVAVNPLSLRRDPSMWRTAPGSFTLNVGPYGQSKRFFLGHAFITINEQGDITLQNASGTQLTLSGSNIIMSAEHDIVTNAGRNIVTLAGRDSSHRAARHYEAATQEGRMTLRAQGQLSVGGGFDGTSGVVVESGSVSQISTAQDGALAYASPGLLLISRKAPIALSTNGFWGESSGPAFFNAPTFTHYSPYAKVYTEIGNGLWMHDDTHSMFIQPLSAYFNNVHVIDSLAGKTFKQISRSVNAQSLLTGTPVALKLSSFAISQSLILATTRASFLTSEEYGVQSAASFQIPMPAWYQYYWRQSTRDATQQTLLPCWYTPSTNTDVPMPGATALAYVLAATSTDTGAYKPDAATSAVAADDGFLRHKLEFSRHLGLPLASLGKGF